jgi:hypothetical protein
MIEVTMASLNDYACVMAMASVSVGVGNFGACDCTFVVVNDLN